MWWVWDRWWAMNEAYHVTGVLPAHDHAGEIDWGSLGYSLC